ncbi:GNAT family N-acetyltransferase [Ornithinibacillus halotolerans]|uniref:Acetyltransferase n=1 Tax=Ornithinibacillus halotolerans TaxID=1274357 RepID=A0A916WC47_9BACI|nr:GNAT family N-acetyltransferase [Ornithinibacillus halotolerans]GGA84509.1 acetyltransferase [Ornithinibacillus halotolerans]
MELNIKKFEELTTNELYMILKARTDVFVVEQNCPYPELDNLDQSSLHLYCGSNSNIGAYLRIIPKGVKYKDAVAIGRVLVVEKHRRNGIAREMMEKALEFITEVIKEETIKIQAQVYLKSFYQSLGFEQISDIYEEDSIPHIDMLLKQH